MMPASDNGLGTLWLCEMTITLDSFSSCRELSSCSNVGEEYASRPQYFSCHFDTFPGRQHVEDNPINQEVATLQLARAGAEVVVAEDGLAALEVLEQQRFDLVLMDCQMPRMDGFDLVRNLRGDTRWAQLPVVMITSRIAHKHREHASALGVHHYLGKPYPEEELLDLVRRCVAPEALRPPTS